MCPAGQVDHAGIPEMTVQTEVDELCCIANALNISTADIEAAVLSHYGNHHAAMKVNAALKCLAASGIMLLICVSWQHCTRNLSASVSSGSH